MKMKTKIEWCERVWNPVVGCSRCAAGCANCYAIKMARWLGANPATPQYAGLTTLRRSGQMDWTGELRFLPERLNDPLQWTKPSRIFVNSMSDLFHEGLPFEHMRQIFIVMARASKHRFLILTKRPQRMSEFFDWLEPDKAKMEPRLLGICAGRPWPLRNVWLGTSVSTQRDAKQNIHWLFKTPAAERFISYEPALEAIDFTALGLSTHGWPTIDWLIVGGESGPKARRCDLNWIRSAIRQCARASVPCFVKQLGSNAGTANDDTWERFPTVHSKGGDPSEWPEDLRIRIYPNGSNVTDR